MKVYLFSAFFLSSFCSFSQTRELDSLRSQMFKGNIEALKSSIKYLDSKKVVTEFLGHHKLNTQERQIAARYITENCFFGRESLLSEDSMSSTKFADFLATNQITFDEDIGYFILKNQNPDSSKYELFKTNTSVIDSINNEFNKSLPQIMRESGAAWSYSLHNPQCLLLLAQYFLKQRTKWNIYNFNDDEYVKCFRYLAHLDFAVQDVDSSINFTYHLTSEFKRRSLFNYFYYHYKDYQWNDSLHYFINTVETPRSKNELTELFESLKSSNDSIALSSFAKICESEPIEVAQLSKQFSVDEYNDNYSLPTFTYKFLPVISNLTSYYRKKNITYYPSPEINIILETLLMDNSFKTRYELEELLINKTTINDIYAIEHFGLINENNFQCTFSIGKVLDKWYSKNWKEVYSDKKHLEAFLKKSKKFEELGIIGICNKYLQKFKNITSPILDSVVALLNTSTDPDILKSATFVMTHYQSPIKEVLDPIKIWDGEKTYSIVNPSYKIQQVIKSSTAKDEKENKIEEISGMITYEQIGIFLKEILKDTTLDNYSKYNFIESDFGFNLDNLENNTIDSFLNKYYLLSKKDLYFTNLLSLGIDLRNKGSYNYQQIYEILKYDVVDAFVGGGGGRRDNNVYQVIKLLELEFGTTLGFVNKLCSWQGTWGCNCSKRARYWMNYLKEKKLVLTDNTEPSSISD